MLKNNDNTIKPRCRYREAHRLRPYTIKVDGNVWSGYTYSCVPPWIWTPPPGTHNVVTDTVGEPTGHR